MASIMEKELQNEPNIPISAPMLAGNELAYVTECIQSGWVSSRGPYVARFEERFADWCGAMHGISTSSGTNALHLALLACEIGPGDEVIVPALTYVASANAIAYTGAVPIFVDVDATWNLDLSLVESKITPRTKAIMVVHLYGHPVEMETLYRLAQQYHLYLIEDACQAHGSLYRGKRVGTLGDIGCFSFFGNKLITTGEGGMIVTNSDPLAEIVRRLRNQGAENGTYWHPRLGFSYRMTNMQAAVGLAQLEQVDMFIAARERIAQSYACHLADIPGVTLYEDPLWAKSVCWLFSVLVPQDVRDGLIDFLKQHGVESKPFFPPLPRLPMYCEDRPYRHAEHLARCGLSLPTFTQLSNDQITSLAAKIREFLHTRR